MPEPKTYVVSFWSDKYGKRLHKVGINGTSKALILDDADLANIVSLASGAIGGRPSTGG